MNFYVSAENVKIMSSSNIKVHKSESFALVWTLYADITVELLIAYNIHIVINNSLCENVVWTESWFNWTVN